MKTLFILMALLPCLGLALAHQAASDLPRIVDDGNGHLLRMRIAGEGTPTVVMEIGLGGVVEEWARSSTASPVSRAS